MSAMVASCSWNLAARCAVIAVVAATARISAIVSLRLIRRLQTAPDSALGVGNWELGVDLSLTAGDRAHCMRRLPILRRGDATAAARGASKPPRRDKSSQPAAKELETVSDDVIQQRLRLCLLLRRGKPGGSQEYHSVDQDGDDANQHAMQHMPRGRTPGDPQTEQERGAQ